MSFYKIPEETVIGLIQYLSQRPYAEVAQGIAGLQSLEKVHEPAPSPRRGRASAQEVQEPATPQ